MAFSRNSSGEAVEQIALNDRSHLQQLDMNNSRLQENATANNEEMTEPVRSNNTGENINSNTRIGDNQPPLRGTHMGGRWGSNFWKDYPPATTSIGASESGEESKSGSEYKGSEVEESDGVEDRVESENDDMTHKEVTRKGHQIVPADEMLSDEYYEQDGDDPNESHYRAANYSGKNSSKLPQQSAAPCSTSRKPKGLKANKYVEEDADFEDDDDDEDGNYCFIPFIIISPLQFSRIHGLSYMLFVIAEDDPDDADFNPDYGATSGNRQIKVFYYHCFSQWRIDSLLGVPLWRFDLGHVYCSDEYFGFDVVLLSW